MAANRADHRCPRRGHGAAAGCARFAAETDSEGADAVTVDQDSYENSAVVTGGGLTQTLTITVTNTFDAPPPAVPPEPPPAGVAELPDTGAPVDTQLGLAALFLAAGLILLATGRRRARRG